jgi:hypothetical protein
LRRAHPKAIYLILGEDEVEKSGLAAEFAELVDEGAARLSTSTVSRGRA